MKEVVKLMDYRPDIKIVDATLRDGGLVNNFRFTDEFVKDLYQLSLIHIYEPTRRLNI